MGIEHNATRMRRYVRFSDWVEYQRFERHVYLIKDTIVMDPLRPSYHELVSLVDGTTLENICCLSLEIVSWEEGDQLYAAREMAK